MKELTIYEKHPEADAYRVGGFYSPYCLVSRDKGFSEAELAAEFQKADADCAVYWLTDREKHMGAWFKQHTLHRFATRPHASESDYQ